MALLSYVFSTQHGVITGCRVPGTELLLEWKRSASAGVGTVNTATRGSYAPCYGMLL